MPNTYSSYNPTVFAHLSTIEDRHFWFVARNRTIQLLSRQILANLGERPRILEVGCGTGNTLRILEGINPNGIVVGMDLFAEGLFYARQRANSLLIQGDILNSPINTEFDFVCILDVLEHLPNDTDVLRQLSTLLSSNGRLLVTVPSHQSLWSYFDVAARHCRRYDSGELEEKLGLAGFQVDYLTQFMVATYPVMWLGRRLASLLHRSQHQSNDGPLTLAMQELRIFPIANRLFIWLLAQETYWIRRRRSLPIGTSLLAIATRKITS